MNKYSYVELLTSSVQSSDLSESALFKWDEVTSNIVGSHWQTGNFQQLLEWLVVVDNPIVLVFPGEQLVLRQVPYDVKDKRHFRKMLPYEVEESVINNVENLHFTIGKMQNDQALVAYIDDEWFGSLWQLFANEGFFISRCFADFQKITVAENEIVCWFNNDRLLVHSYDGTGFSTSMQQAPMFIESLLAEVADKERLDLRVIASLSDEESAHSGVEKIQNIFNTLVPEKALVVESGAAVESLENKQIVNLCSGKYDKKASSSDGNRSTKWLLALTLFAWLVFVGSNVTEAYLLQKKSEKIQEAIVASVRQVIPQGFIQDDPRRQLRTKIQGTATSDNEPSISIYLLSQIAPVIQSLNIDVSTINYSNKEKALRLNVQANSFNQVEKLRLEIVTKGLDAELLSSNAIENKFQARLRVSLGVQ